MCSVSKTSSFSSSDDESELRRGPWTDKEDNILIHYISCHGEGHWNLLANRSGLKRTGRSCRFRWVNYLKPDVKRGNLTPEEQQLILHLHSKWGNRWSKIAQYLPGRTDNEIKNYWRTRVQKQARYLKNIDTKSREFFQEPFPFSPDLKSLQNPTFNLALIRKPPSYTSERPHTSVNNQLFSSSESAIFSKDPGLQNMGCNFYYNQSNYTESFNVNYIHDMKTVNFSSGDSANTIAGDNDRVWNWDMDEFWK